MLGIVGMYSASLGGTESIFFQPKTPIKKFAYTRTPTLILTLTSTPTIVHSGHREDYLDRTKERWNTSCGVRWESRLEG